jgi:quercetin 2,3-dioxygenase
MIINQFMTKRGPLGVDAGPPWRRTGFPRPAPQELRFLPAPKDGVSTKESADDGRLRHRPLGVLTPQTTRLHGAQRWVALPDADRFTAPGFAHHVPPVVDLADGARARVLLGTLAGCTSPVKTFTPLLGAELTLPAGRSVRLAVSPAYEHGVLIDTGEVTVAGCTAGPGHLVHREPGAETLTVTASPSSDARVLLLGGEPLGEQIMMWWNFVGRTHEEIVAFREEWQAAREPGAEAGRYGPFPDAWRETLPAPPLPHARLRLRG